MNKTRVKSLSPTFSEQTVEFAGKRRHYPIDEPAFPLSPGSFTATSADAVSISFLLAAN
jgi:hypothetical protein